MCKSKDENLPPILVISQSQCRTSFCYRLGVGPCLSIITKKRVKKWIYRDCIILPNGVGISPGTAGEASFVLVVGFRPNFSTQILPPR